MKIHCIRHEPFEGLAYIEEWIHNRKYDLNYTRTYLNQAFPEETKFDMLIIMGGTASVYQESEYAWLSEEKKFIAEALDNNIKVLGICFGAQILADVLGSKVYPSPCKEIGWFPVTFSPESIRIMNFLPDEITTFHWHGDTFDLPPGTVHLASSDCIPNQGFIKDDQIVALQFHPEMNQAGINSLLSIAGHELKQDQFVQTEAEMRQYNNYIEENNSLMLKFLEFLCPDEKK